MLHCRCKAAVGTRARLWSWFVFVGARRKVYDDQSIHDTRGLEFILSLVSNLRLEKLSSLLSFQQVGATKVFN